jgi:Polysaccharide deacetylase
VSAREPRLSAVCLTLDVDWAPEHVLQSVIARLVRAGVPATFFATHDSPTLRGLDPGQFEVGLHPNFNDSAGDHLTPLAVLKSLYPAASGARSHSLFSSSRILALYADHGLSYESNIFLPGHTGLHPVLRFADLVSIPFNWSDDKQLELGAPHDLTAVPLDAEGLVVLNFHPIHVAMNTSDPAHYERYKAHIRDRAALARMVNDDQPGTGTVFDAALEWLAANGRRVLTLAQVRDEFLAMR